MQHHAMEATACPLAPPSPPPVRPAAPAELTEGLLRQFDTPGPRYTSYPTADRFGSAFGPDDAAAALDALAAADPAMAQPVSVYVHIPFCEQLCYYCACNKIITRHHERAAEYLDHLEIELGLVGTRIGHGRPVSQLHFGGGSPTFLSDDELSRVMAALRGVFTLQPDAEVSIEVDPRTVTAARLAHFRTLGFNRLSFGVQDFDADVQQAVHRVQSLDMVRSLMAAARELGYVSINADLIYGLPRQTPESFARTIAQMVELRPDRLAMYAYAHLPTRFKPQRRIHDADLPPPADRIAMLGGALAALQTSGYDYIGMDHFALPDDALAVAKRQGRLHRNFQGYSTQSDRDLVALGVSSIGQVAGHFYQNDKTLPGYYEALQASRLPVVRGYATTADDRLRREVIMAVMCQGRVDYAAVEARHGIDFADTFATELAELQAMAGAGLVRLTAEGLEVTPAGWYLVRAIAMVFDRHLRASQDRARFSKVL